MQKGFNLAICFLLLLLSIFCINKPIGKVQADTNTKEITVFGSAVVNATPDVAVVNVGIENLNANINVAVEENNETMSKIIEYLKSIGITEENIQTKNYSVYQRYNYNDGEKFLGYQVDNGLEFKTTDLQNLSSVLTKLTDLGANKLGGITFTCSDLENYYNKALKLALENAKSKMESLTDENLSVCKIEEKSLYSNEIYRDSAFVLARANKESIVKGSLQIEAKIEVKFCK